jgi:NAD(P)-dependent dehydrogenase (short-subunit alcohol dehydrogenase family)
MRVKDKVAIITGAGSGIGRAAALLFSEEGAAIVVADLNLSKAIQTVEAIQENGGRALPLKADVTSASAESRCDPRQRSSVNGEADH